MIAPCRWYLHTCCFLRRILEHWIIHLWGWPNYPCAVRGRHFVVGRRDLVTLTMSSSSFYVDQYLLAGSFAPKNALRNGFHIHLPEMIAVMMCMHHYQWWDLGLLCDLLPCKHHQLAEWLLLHIPVCNVAQNETMYAPRCNVFSACTTWFRLIKRYGHLSGHQNDFSTQQVFSAWLVTSNLMLFMNSAESKLFLKILLVVIILRKVPLFEFMIIRFC